MVEFDQTTGAFVRVVADGTSGERGTTFSPRPFFNVYAHVAAERDRSRFKHIVVDRRLKDFSDPTPRVRLTSIESTDPRIDIRAAVRNAAIGEEDYEFDLDFDNDTGVAQHYTISYLARNTHDLTKIATTEVPVPPR